MPPASNSSFKKPAPKRASTIPTSFTSTSWTKLATFPSLPHGVDPRLHAQTSARQRPFALCRSRPHCRSTCRRPAARRTTSAPKPPIKSPSTSEATCIPLASLSLNSPSADNPTSMPPPPSKNGSKPTNFSSSNFPKNDRRPCRPLGAPCWSDFWPRNPKNRYDSYDELLRAIDLSQPLKLPPAEWLALHNRLFCTRVPLDTRHSSSTK